MVQGINGQDSAGILSPKMAINSTNTGMGRKTPQRPHWLGRFGSEEHSVQKHRINKQKQFGPDWRAARCSFRVAFVPAGYTVHTTAGLTHRLSGWRAAEIVCDPLPPPCPAVYCDGETSSWSGHCQKSRPSLGPARAQPDWQLERTPHIFLHLICRTVQEVFMLKCSCVFVLRKHGHCDHHKLATRKVYPCIQSLHNPASCPPFHPQLSLKRSEIVPQGTWCVSQPTMRIPQPVGFPNVGTHAYARKPSCILARCSCLGCQRCSLTLNYNP